MADSETLAVYAKRAADYAERFGKAGEGPHMTAFLAEIPEGGRILDLGSGPGHTAAAMMRAGYNVEAWDASPEFVKIARDRYGVNARLATFEDLDAREAYDAVFANFSLLHAPKSDMPGYLARIAKALKPKGVFHIGLKAGTGEKRDAIGRFYAYYELDELTQLLADAGFRVVRERTGEEEGLDGTVAPWIILLARKND